MQCISFIGSCHRQLNAMKNETLQESAKVATHSVLSSMVCICVCPVAFIVIYGWVVLLVVVEYITRRLRPHA